jgi:predicted secreted protein
MSTGYNLAFGVMNPSQTRFFWRRAYDAATLYNANDFVSYLGGLYLALSTFSGNLPTNTLFWDQVLSSGSVSSVAGRTGAITLSSVDISDHDAAGGVPTLDGSGFLKAAESTLNFNAQTGTTYAFVAGDRGKVVTFNNAASVAVTIAAATGSFGSGWFTEVENIGAGLVTITPTTSTIDGAANVVLKQWESVTIVSNGTNYLCLRSKVRVAAADITNGTTGSGAVVLATSPTLVAPVITGAATASQLNGVICLGTTYTTIALGLAALPASGGVVIVPNGYVETVGADIIVSHDSGLLFMGTAAINMGTHQFKFAGGTANGFFIDSMIPFGSNGSPSAGVVFTYTGATTPFSFGDTTTDSFGLSLRNFAVNVAGGGAAVAAITLNRLHPFSIENVRLIGTTGQIGVKCDGTAGYTGDGVIKSLSTNGFTSGIQLFANGNAIEVSGGTSIANTATGGKGIDIVSGNGNWIKADIESATVGVNIAGSANNFGNRVSIYGQGNGTDFVLGALSSGNIVENVGANGGSIVISVTDSGTNNSVVNPYKLKADVNGLITTSGGVTVSAGKNVSSGRLISTGTAPTSVAVTGAGASGTASLIAGSTDSAGIIRIACAGAGPAASGTITLTLSAALGVSFVTGELIPSSAVTAWNGRATIFQTNYSNATPIFSWDNNTVALVAGNSYDIIYRCVGQ